MKVFISYGHNDYTELVDAVFDALLQDGHQPWKDDRYEGRSGIPAGEDFTKVIYDAIRDSDCVLAFVTSKTLAKPYCCDERQYAYNHKGHKFIQLRLDGVEIRLGNAGSYIDMDACVDGTGQINHACLREKLVAIYAAFRSPDALISPDAKLERYLKIRGALSYDEFVTMPEREDFVGREWLKQQCIEWVQDASIPCRLFAILGEAGTGKTAFVRHLAEDRTLVRSVHVCIYDRPVTRNIKGTLKDLAYMLTTTNAAYRDYLKNKDFEQLEQLDYDGLFEFLFIEPLKDEKEKYLLIIDGLDELEETTGLRPLMQVLRQFASRLNPNISILVTGRPEENIVSKLKTIHGTACHQSILLGKDNGQNDLCAYIEKNLRELGRYSEALLQKLYDACDGNFEYLSLLFKEAKEEGLALSVTTTLPRGLSERYTQYLDRRTEQYNGNESFTKVQKTVIAMLSVAYEPISYDLMSAVSGLDEEDIKEALTVLGSLVRKERMSDGTTLVAFFSKSFRDYLLSEDCEKYGISARVGTKLFAAYVLERCPTDADFCRYGYVDTYGYAHLLIYIHSDPSAVRQYVNQMINTYGDHTLVRIADALCVGGLDVAEALFDVGNGIEQKSAVKNLLLARREVGVLWQVVKGYQKTGNHWYANFLKADILAMDPSPKSRLSAQLLYDKVIAALEEHVKQHPDSVGLLFSVYERMGDFCMAKGTKEGAKEAAVWYGKMQIIAEEKRRKRIGKDDHQEMMILYNRFGDIAVKTGTKKGRREAAKWYKKLVVLSRRLYTEEPSYNTRRALAVACDRMAGVEYRKHTASGHKKAMRWYREAIVLAEQNCEEMPCYQSRRLLSQIYAHMAETSFAAKKNGRFEKAVAWCDKEIALSEQNCQETPCYESRKDLADAYQRICEIEKKKNTPESRVRAEIWQEKMLLLLMQNYNENPYYTARCALAEAYRWIGHGYRLNGTPDDLQKAKGWYEKALELHLQSYRDKQEYQRRRLLSLVCADLGETAKACGTAQSILQAARWYEKVLDLNTQNYTADPCRESWNDVVVTYNRIRSLAAVMRKVHGAKAAKAWRKKMFAALSDGMYDTLG